jgi:hypothetical protein
MMYRHVKKLMYTVNIGAPDVRFGNMLLEQFGGGNGELAAAMQYLAIDTVHKSATNPRRTFDEIKFAGTSRFCSARRFVAEEARSRVETGGSPW